MGRANPYNEFNASMYFDRGMLNACSVQIGEIGSVVATASLENNTLTVESTELISGYFYVFGK